MKTKIIINEVIKNVAPRFKKAIWRKYDVNEMFASYKDASKYYDLRNCNYDYVYTFTDEIVKTVRNAKLDGYGRRYN